MANTYYSYSYDGVAGSSYNRSYVPTTRFTISSNVYLPCGEIDFRTGMIKPEYTRRRTQAARLNLEETKAKEAGLLRSIEKETAKSGIQISVRAFILVVVSVILLLGFMLLYTTGRIEVLNKEILSMQESILEYETDNSELEEQIAYNSSAEVITDAAVNRLGMKHCNERKAIHLTAPETRPSGAESNGYANSYVEPAYTIHSSADAAPYNPFASSGY